MKGIEAYDACATDLATIRRVTLGLLDELRSCATQLSEGGSRLSGEAPTPQGRRAAKSSTGGSRPPRKAAKPKRRRAAKSSTGGSPLTNEAFHEWHQVAGHFHEMDVPKRVRERIFDPDGPDSPLNLVARNVRTGETEEFDFVHYEDLLENPDFEVLWDDVLSRVESARVAAERVFDEFERAGERDFTPKVEEIAALIRRLVREAEPGMRRRADELPPDTTPLIKRAMVEVSEYVPRGGIPLSDLASKVQEVEPAVDPAGLNDALDEVLKDPEFCVRPLTNKNPRPLVGERTELALCVSRGPGAPAPDRESEDRSANVQRAGHSFSDDFTSAIWFGASYRFTKGNQAECIRCLYKAWEDGGHSLSQESIGKMIESSAERFDLRKTFRRRKPQGGYEQHPAWGTMIQQVTKGSYRLTPPESA